MCSRGGESGRRGQGLFGSPLSLLASWRLLKWEIHEVAADLFAGEAILLDQPCEGGPDVSQMQLLLQLLQYTHYHR